jgi:hypothetical protein
MIVLDQPVAGSVPGIGTGLERRLAFGRVAKDIAVLFEGDHAEPARAIGETHAAADAGVIVEVDDICAVGAVEDTHSKFS